MGHDQEHSATMFIPPDVYERMRNGPRDDAPAPSVVTRPRYDGEERTLASQRDPRIPAPQAAVAVAIVEEPSSMEVDPRELLDPAVHPGVPVTPNGTLLMEAMPYLVGTPEQTQIKRRVPAPHMVAPASMRAPEGMSPDSARVRRELDEMSMVFEPHALSRRLATASDDEMVRYLDSLRISQGLPPQDQLRQGAAGPAPLQWQQAPAPLREDASQARFDPIAQRFAPPPGLEPEPTHAPQSAFAPQPFAFGPAPELQAAPAMSPQPGYGHAASAQHPSAFPPPAAQHPSVFAPPAAQHPAVFAPPGGSPMQPSPFALPPSQRRLPLASTPPVSQMPPFVPAPPKKGGGNAAMFAVMFLAALVGVGAATYVALRAGQQGAVTGPLTSERVADAG